MTNDDRADKLVRMISEGFPSQSAVKAVIVAELDAACAEAAYAFGADISELLDKARRDLLSQREDFVGLMRRQWIPVGERLPAHGEWALIVTASRDMHVAQRRDNHWWWDGRTRMSEAVIAWQPVPATPWSGN